MNKIIKLILIFFLFTHFALANESKVFDFTNLELSQLEVRKVRGADNKTIYKTWDI